MQLFEFPAHIFAQQIVQFAHGHHHPGMAQRCGARWTIAQIDLPGLRWVDRQGGLSRSRGSGSLSRAYSRSAATGCQRSACGGRGRASSRGCCSRYWRGVTPCWRLNKSLIIRVLANPCSRAICWTVLRVVNSWSAAWRRRSAVRYWTKLTPTSLRNKRDSRCLGDKFRGRHLLQREATLIVSVDPRYHAGYSPAPFFGIAPGRGGDGLAKARGQQQRYLTQPAVGLQSVMAGDD